jgi:thiamine-phosphate pyrophosphorylase
MTAEQLRPATLRRLRAIARARGHTLLHAGRPAAGYDGVHNAQMPRAAGFHSMAVHTAWQAAAARRRGVDAALISPVYATRSHPDAKGIGAGRFTQLAQQSGTAAIALGGMTAARYRCLRSHGAHGWAAIDAWLK